MEDKHYQNALSLYEMILDNVNEMAINLCKHKPEYLDSARIGALESHVDGLCHMLNDVQIESLKQRMQGFSKRKQLTRNEKAVECEM